jgi:hypothetical protein
MDHTRRRIVELVNELPDDVREVLAEVLRLEKDKLHLKLPRGIVEDIADVIKRVVI